MAAIAPQDGCLEVDGAQVLMVVSDDAQTNKTVWKLYGVGMGENQNQQTVNILILHPMNYSFKKIMLDLPHAWKTFRNQMFNNKEVFEVLSDKNGNFDGYPTAIAPHKLVDDLFLIDTVFGQCKLCPRLSQARVEIQDCSTPTGASADNTDLAANRMCTKFRKGAIFFNFVPKRLPECGVVGRWVGRGRTALYVLLAINKL